MAQTNTAQFRAPQSSETGTPNTDFLGADIEALKREFRDALADDPVPVRSAAQPIPFKGAKLADDRLAERRRPLSPVVVSGSLRAADFLTVALLGLAIAHVYVDDTGGLQNTIYLVATAFAGVATVAV